MIESHTQCFMNIIIFEGIASSGKTTIGKKLLERLPNTKIIEETETLMPLIDNRDEKIANEHLLSLFQTITKSNVSNIILDRFHLTHAFRTKADIQNFVNIESELEELGHILVVFLTIKQNVIRGRIKETIGYRKDDWNKGGQGVGTLDEKVEYYTTQQITLRNLVTKSSLKYMEIDTTKKDWSSAVTKILNKLSA